MAEQEKKTNERKPKTPKPEQKVEMDKSVVYVGVKPVRNYATHA